MNYKNMKEIKVVLENYKEEFKHNEIAIPLAIIAEMLVEISLNTEDIVKKMYQ